MSSPEAVPSSGSFFSPTTSYTTDDIKDGKSTHISKTTFKPSSSNDSLSYVTMPRGMDKRDDMKRWKAMEENNNENAFSPGKGLFFHFRVFVGV